MKTADFIATRLYHALQLALVMSCMTLSQTSFSAENGDTLSVSHPSSLSSQTPSAAYQSRYAQNYADGGDFFQKNYQKNYQKNDQTDYQKNTAKAVDGFNHLQQPFQRSSGAPPLCSGQFVTPFATQQKPVNDIRQSTSTLSADRGYYNPQGISILEGNVTIDQPGRHIEADRVQLSADQVHATAMGDVEFAQQGFLSKSQRVDYNLATKTGSLEHSFYISEAQQAHGYAAAIEQLSPQVVQLSHASFSTCSPSTVPDWHLEADQLTLDRDNGRGISKNARFYIKDMPLLTIPYFNFPIDSRRSSGFLVPSFGYTNDGGLQLGIPYYFNLAPNYDLTATPRYVGGHGVMVEGDFGYLTSGYGQGHIWGGYLPSDNAYNDKNRSDIHWQHLWDIYPQLTGEININQVSDKDYFTDLGTSPDSEDSVYQERTAVLSYHDGFPGLNAQLKVQKFQTLDPTIADVDRPYERLPQLLVQYQTGDSNGLQYGINNDTAYFKKNLDNPTDVPKYPSGLRIYNHAFVRYNYRAPSFYITPQMSVRSIHTFYDKDTLLDLGYSKNDNVQKSVMVPQFSLDSRLFLEKSGRYLQTLTPRLFYVYSPYENQSDFPNFDSANASINYDQLFSPYRFYGHDRLEDNHFASLGLTYRLYDDYGLERLRAALGQSFYFGDRRVRLNDSDPIATSRNSGPVLSIGSQLSQTFNVTANAAWRPNGQNTFSNLSVSYADDIGRTYSLGYYNRQQVIELNQQKYQQAAFGFIQPMNERWRVLGQSQYDIDHNYMREWLLGIHYQACCWALSVYGRSYYNDLDDPTVQHLTPKRMVMAEFSLKGLGGLSGKLSSLLENRIIGFDRSNQSWISH